MIRLQGKRVATTSGRSTGSLGTRGTTTRSFRVHKPSRAAPVEFPTPQLAKVLRDSARARIRAIEMEDGHDGSTILTYKAFHPPPVPKPKEETITLADIINQNSDRQENPLVDSFSRKHDYLRISLTDKCNLQCFYCMPEEGVETAAGPEMLSDDEIVRLASIFVRNGVKKIRLTGGEPTIRKGLVELVGKLSSLRPMGLNSIGMTTNGVALHRKLPGLLNNGLTHLNLSLDSLKSDKFEQMTRRRGHEAVMKSLRIALESPALHAVKINVVVIKGVNDEEVLDFVELTREQRLSVRFIEFMPFSGNRWNRDKLIPSSELLARIKEKHPNIRKQRDDQNDTARSFAVEGFKGSFGFISSMSDHFCSTCNRVRVTADGKIKVCLFDGSEISLRDQMRAGASDAHIEKLLGYAISQKKESHAGMEDIDTLTNRPMVAIGG